MRKMNFTANVMSCTGKQVRKFSDVKFYHEEIKRIFMIPYLVLNNRDVDEIINLPRDTAIKDFEQIIKITMKNFIDPIALGVNRNSVDIALIFLAHFKAVESFPVLLDYLRQDIDYLYIWQNCGAIENYTWQIFAHCAMTKCKEMISFVLEPDIYTWNRVVISQALDGVARWCPELYDYVIVMFRTLLIKYYDVRDDVDAYDSEFVGVTEKFIVELGAVELLPVLEMFHNESIIDEVYCGKFEKVVKTINKIQRPLVPETPKSIKSILKDFYKIAYTKDDEEDDLLADLLDCSNCV